MKKIYITILILILTSLTACNNTDEYDQIQSEQQVGSSDETTENEDKNEDNQTEEKIKAPDFELTDLEGNVVKLSELEGKYVFINFWTTWCGFCKEEMPYIQKMYEEYEINRDEVIFLAVDMGEDPDKVKEFIESNNYSFTVLLDENETLAKDYYIPGFPTTYFIDKEGYVLGYVASALQEEQMKEILDNIINGEIK